MSVASEIPLSPGDASPLALKPLLAATPLEIYRHRSQRLATLAEGSPLADYLKLCQLLVSAQLTVASTAPFGPAPELDMSVPVPLAAAHTLGNPYWLGLLQSLLSELLPQVPAQVAEVIRELMSLSPAQLAAYGDSLRLGQLSEVPSQYSLFLWAALSLYWAHWAPMVIARMDVAAVKQTTLCPVCGSHPVASVIREEPREGLRYLHCSLCETQWHYVRAQCTNCDDAKQLSLWALDDHKANIRIESCDNCHGYTKMLFVAKDPRMEVVADDLASLGLDGQLSEQGYRATTINPLLLAHES
ncbi:formate dehydrogenase accessory protein FdhE [Shewanella sp. YIC-542]|uniref:formate dehydrogenase accessory protein FdhE n=1 Tax=Shewanella mytili TaxID=3377111 RepID=UPI00398F6C57